MKRHRSRTLGWAGLLSACLHLCLVSAVTWLAGAYTSENVAAAVSMGDERSAVEVSSRDFLTAEEMAALWFSSSPNRTQT